MAKKAPITGRVPQGSNPGAEFTMRKKNEMKTGSGGTRGEVMPDSAWKSEAQQLFEQQLQHGFPHKNITGPAYNLDEAENDAEKAVTMKGILSKML